MRSAECGVRNELARRRYAVNVSGTPQSALRNPHLERGAGGETRTPVGRIARQFTKLLLSLLSHAGRR